jgi:hypothetical protein
MPSVSQRASPWQVILRQPVVQLPRLHQLKDFRWGGQTSLASTPLARQEHWRLKQKRAYTKWNTDLQTVQSEVSLRFLIKRAISARPKTCPFCTTNFAHKSSLYRHLRSETACHLVFTARERMKHRRAVVWFKYKDEPAPISLHPPGIVFNTVHTVPCIPNSALY